MRPAQAGATGPLASPLFTVGHSTHGLDELATLLRRHGVEVVADVRTIPRSRRVPHFNADELEKTLPRRHLAYRHLPALGGWRTPLADSPNGGWRNRSFQGYADHMLTSEFRRGLEELAQLAATRRTAVMCAEAAWWRCHRRLIADRLLAGGAEVRHIGPDGALFGHELTGFAVVRALEVLYPGATGPGGPHASAGSS
jgi:uncharacterized protein (DUF488 family)